MRDADVVVLQLLNCLDGIRLTTAPYLMPAILPGEGPGVCVCWGLETHGD